jgi:hypothetical protein
VQYSIVTMEAPFREGTPGGSPPVIDDAKLIQEPGHPLPRPIEFHGSEEPTLRPIGGADGPLPRLHPEEAVAQGDPLADGAR